MKKPSKGTGKGATKAPSSVDQIRKKLGHLTLESEPCSWMDTGIPELNMVLGSTDYGVPFGRIIELFGMESHGKTALALTLEALAQASGAAVIHGDFESSFDPVWAARRNLDPTKVMVFRPYVGKFGNEKQSRLCTSEELCSEIEAGMEMQYNAGKRSIVVLDSLTAILTEGEEAAGLTESNMRSKMELPMFLSRLLRRWVGYAHSYNALVILINQLRQKPGVMFGDPWYTPGGNAPRFYSHVRAKVRRLSKNGRMRDEGKVVGIRGIISCVKNKVGGVEGSEVGYEMRFDGTMAFMTVAEVKKRAGGDDGDE